MNGADPSPADGSATATPASPGRRLFLYLLFAGLWVVYIERLLQLLAPPPPWDGWLRVGAGLLLAGSSATLMWWSWRHEASIERHTSRSVLSTRRPWPWWLLVGLLTLVGVAATLAQHRRTESARLQAIAATKAAQVHEWLGERMADLRYVGATLPEDERFQRWLERPDDARAAAGERLLVQFAARQGVDSVMLLDAEGMLLLSGVPGGGPVASLPSLDDLRAVRAAGAARMLGPVAGPSGLPVIDLAVPMQGPRRLLLVTRVLPEQRLRQLLQGWPAPSASGEAVLARAYRGGVLYIARAGAVPEGEPVQTAPGEHPQSLAARLLAQPQQCGQIGRAHV
jgi:hypothetical protein